MHCTAIARGTEIESFKGREGSERERVDKRGASYERLKIVARVWTGALRARGFDFDFETAIYRKAVCMWREANFGERRVIRLWGRSKACGILSMRDVLKVFFLLL